MRQALLLGCGHDHRRRVLLESQQGECELVKLDMSPHVGADVVWDMNQLPLPFADEAFDEIHAYDTLEHWGGPPGNWRFFFDEFTEYWRILKPGGTIAAVVPIGVDRYADPGHCRFFSATWFAFLSKTQAEHNARQGTQMTDYRCYYQRDFDILRIETQGDHHLIAVLRKVM